MTNDTGKAVEILLVEDNPGDVELILEVMERGKVLNKASVVTDGDGAMDYLRGVGRHVGKPRPDLVLLDLNLLKKDGREVLAEIKADPDLRSILVVVMTSSRAETDVLRSYDLLCNCYVTKPLDLIQFNSVVEAVLNFWLPIVQLPREEAWP